MGKHSTMDLWPEQELYEQLRPILLFGETAGQRAKESNAAGRTLSRKADEFERDGMRSLFSSEEPEVGLGSLQKSLIASFCFTQLMH